MLQNNNFSKAFPQDPCVTGDLVAWLVVDPLSFRGPESVFLYFTTVQSVDKRAMFCFGKYVARELLNVGLFVMEGGLLGARGLVHSWVGKGKLGAYLDWLCDVVSIVWYGSVGEGIDRVGGHVIVRRSGLSG